MNLKSKHKCIKYVIKLMDFVDQKNCSNLPKCVLQCNVEKHADFEKKIVSKSKNEKKCKKLNSYCFFFTWDFDTFSRA